MFFLNQIRPLTGKVLSKDRRKAQASLELALSLTCALLLLFGSLNLFLWLNRRIVHRQEDYENTRVAAGSNQPGVEVNQQDAARYPRLDIFR